MRLDLLRLLMLAIVFTLSAPMETASAQKKSNGAMTKKKKKQGKKKRNKRRKKRGAAKKGKNGSSDPVPVEDSPFEDSDSVDQEGQKDASDDLEPSGETASKSEANGASGRSGGPSEERGQKSSLNLGSEEESGEPSDGSLRRSGRMEFDERLVKGQAAKSGAVYLFKRMPRRLPGLIPLRRSYRRRIVEPVLGRRPLKPALFSNKDTTGKKKKKLSEDTEDVTEEPPAEPQEAETEERE